MIVIEMVTLCNSSSKKYRWKILVIITLFLTDVLDNNFALYLAYTSTPFKEVREPYNLFFVLRSDIILKTQFDGCVSSIFCHVQCRWGLNFSRQLTQRKLNVLRKTRIPKGDSPFDQFVIVRPSLGK